MTTEKGSFLNKSHRSGCPDSFRAGTQALERRMSDRFRSKVAGRGTNWLMQKEVEHYQNLVKKREDMAREGGKRTPKAAARVKKTKEKLEQWKALAVQGDAKLRKRKKEDEGAQQKVASGSSSSSAGGPTIFTDLDRVLDEEPDVTVANGDNRNVQRDQEQPKGANAGGVI